MKQKQTMFLLFSVLFAFSYAKDISTFSNYEQIKQTKLEGNFFIDFNRTVISGKIKLYMEAITDGEIIVLDTRALNIINVIDSDTGDELEFETDYQFELAANGLPLKIYKSYIAGNKFALVIDYETTSDGSAVQFLKKEQTTGKQYPFMFTQCESILTRELLPIQDTPAVKLTVEVGLTVEKPLLALESGIFQSKIDNGDTVTYFYSQKIPIPSYLIAMAAGKIEERQISDRTKVYAEAELVEKAVYEFSETETFLQLAEAYATPYEWGEYNLLILPSSFPFGGMENPVLTFVTPSLLAGDKSLADVVAHELSHSWSGNLVTMNSWTDFWLNEGFTMFLQRKIIEQKFDTDLAKLSALFDYSTMASDIRRYGESKSFSSLRPNLLGRHPDDAFSTIPYEKGFNFLYYVESIVKPESEIDIFRKMIRTYFNKFKYKSIDYYDFRNFFTEFIKSELPDKADGILEKIDWKNWIEDPGFPKQSNDFTNKYSIEADEALEQFYKGELNETWVETFKEWHTLQKQYFLRSIRDSTVMLDENQQTFLTKTMNLKEGYNAEVTFEYLDIILGHCKNISDEEKAKLIDFLGQYGRMKYIRPLYRDFYKIDSETALSTFEKYKSSYHPIAVRLIEDDFKHA